MRDVKKILLVASMAFSAVTAFAQAADDPNPFSTYDKGMASDRNWPTAVEWQDANRTAVEAATAEDVLAGFVADETAADTLLLQIRDAYESDPLVLTQIAAVSQWTMSEEPFWIFFWKASPASGRRVWTSALMKRLRTAALPYVQMACLEQLRWCGYPEQSADLRELASGNVPKEVKEFALRTASELDMRKER